MNKDGIGLFASVMKHFLNQGPDCPLVIGTTHFHGNTTETRLSHLEIYAHQLLPMDHPFMTHNTMEIFQEQGEEEIVFLYR
jgi:DNA mismatch repair ATPase MutS